MLIESDYKNNTNAPYSNRSIKLIHYKINRNGLKQYTLQLILECLLVNLHL